MDKKQKKIIIIGFGSIGQRHYRNLIKLGYRNVAVYDINSAKIIEQGIKPVKDLSILNLKNFDIAFICNPNNEHIKTALLCAQAGCHLFIEKPLSHNSRNIDKLVSLCKAKKLTCLIGCNMRFHPCLQFIKKYLTAGKLGNIYRISHEFGYYLPYWRPTQDYRLNYAAKKETGGGIILDDIHEFDLLFWLNDFSPVQSANFFQLNTGKLEIETEDNCLAIFNFENKVLGSVSCDYLQQSYSRKCKIVGEKGNLEWDFKENIVWLKTKDLTKKLFSVADFDFNKVYIDEVKYFFNCIGKNESTFNDLETAAKILKVCLKR